MMSFAFCMRSWPLSAARHRGTLCTVYAHLPVLLVPKTIRAAESPLNSNRAYLAVTFAAASVLLATVLCPDLDVRLDTTFETSWERALQIFEFHKLNVPGADKGIEALEKLKRSVAIRAETLLRGGADSPASGGADAPSIGDTVVVWDESLSGQVSWEELLNSDALDQRWFTSLDFGEDNWMLQ